MLVPVQIDVVGTSPLMVCNEQTADRLNPMAKSIAELTAKRKRSDEEELEMRRRKWLASLYFDEKLGPYLPALMLWRSIQDAARRTKEGMTIERGLFIGNGRLPLQYKGPRDLETMWDDGRFVDARTAVASGRRIVAVRGIFPDWAVSAEMSVDTNELNVSDLGRFVTLAGKSVGVGTYRKMFGRYLGEVKTLVAAVEAA